MKKFRLCGPILMLFQVFLLFWVHVMFFFITKKMYSGKWIGGQEQYWIVFPRISFKVCSWRDSSSVRFNSIKGTIWIMPSWCSSTINKHLYDTRVICNWNQPKMKGSMLLFTKVMPHECLLFDLKVIQFCRKKY